MCESKTNTLHISLTWLSVIGYLLIIFAAAIVDGRYFDLEDLLRIVFFYGYWFSYQLIFALAVGNACDVELKRSVRIVFALIWFYSFVLMLANILVLYVDLYVEELILFMAVLTPLSCLFAGIYLILHGHTFSGAITGALFLISWVSPFGIYMFHFCW